MTKLTRTAVCEQTREDEYEASLASDEPVDRGGYLEVLRCTPDAVDLRRARDGLPLLLHHDRSRIAGRVVGVRADGRRVRGRLRFADTPDGREGAALLRAGHRELSVGYQISADTEQPPGTIVATRWMPYETSIVSVPADEHVGIARNQTMTTTPSQTEAPADASDDANSPHLTRSQRRAERDAVETERMRIKGMRNIGRMFGVPEAQVERWIDDGVTAQAAMQVASEIQAARSANPHFEIIKHRGDDPNTAAGRFDLTRALQAQIDPAAYGRHAGFEAEYSRELARSAPLPTSGVLVPMEVFFRRELRAAQARSMDAGTPTSGGNFVPTQIAGQLLIEALRQRSVTMRLGATVLPGLGSPVTLPKVTATSTVGWLGEVDNASESTPTTGGPTLSPKRVGAYSDVSKQLLLGSAVAMQELVQADLSASIMAELDRAALLGSGSNDQPTGVRYVTDVNEVAGGTDGATLAWSHILGLESAVEDDSAMVNVGTAGYIINPATRAFLKKTPRVTGEAAGLMMGDVPPDAEGIYSLNGYRTAVTGKLPANLAKGTSGNVCSLLFYGDWSQLVVGIFGPAVELIVDPYTLAKSAQLRVVANLFADVAVRHPQAFAFMRDAKLS